LKRPGPELLRWPEREKSAWRLVGGEERSPPFFQTRTGKSSVEDEKTRGAGQRGRISQKDRFLLHGEQQNGR